MNSRRRFSQSGPGTSCRTTCCGTRCCSAACVWTDAASIRSAPSPARKWGAAPRHGSALFTRGETQALVTVTLGTSADAQRLDWIEGESFKRFMLHSGPPFSVGEVKFLPGQAGERSVMAP